MLNYNKRPLFLMSPVGGGLDGGLSYINRSPPPPPAALPPPLIPAEEFMFVLLSLPQTMGAPPSFNNGARPQSRLSVALWDRFPETETKTSGWNPVSLIRKKAAYKMVEWEGGGAAVFLSVSALTRQPRLKLSWVIKSGGGFVSDWDSSCTTSQT